MPISSEMMGITLVSISVTVYNGRREPLTVLAKTSVLHSCSVFAEFVSAKRSPAHIHHQTVGRAGEALASASRPEGAEVAAAAYLKAFAAPAVGIFLVTPWHD